MMNRAERDVELLDRAVPSRERVLFPLLVLVERLGPIGVVELAARVGRDYTTVSRQVARLEDLKRADHRSSATDKRVRGAIITPHAKAVTDALEAAREKMAATMFRSWGTSVLTIWLG